MKRWQQHAALLLPALIYFAPVLFFGRVFFYRDNGLYFYPHRQLIWAALHAGHLPQWDPYEFAGMPLLADPNYNVFHPFSLLNWLLPMPWSFGLFVCACAVAAAYGARQMALELGLDDASAVVAGLVFAWCGPFVSLIQAGQLVGPAFVPWVCAASIRLAREPTRRSTALLAIAAALEFLSGTPEIGACGFLVGFLFAWRGGWKARGLFVAGCSLGAGLAMVQILPTALFSRESSRSGGGFGWSDSTAGSFYPRRLPELLIPFWSSAPDTDAWLYSDDERNWLEQAYFGAIPILLAAYGARKSRPWRAAWIACGVLLLLALGRHTPLYALLWKIFPPIHRVRFPEKLIAPLAVPLSLSAAAGWARVREGLPAPRKLIGGAIAAVLAGIAGWAFLARLELPQWREVPLQLGALETTPREFALMAIALLVAAAWSRKLIGARAGALLTGALLAVDLGAPALRANLVIPAAELTAPSPLLEVFAKDSAGEPWDYRVDVHMTGVGREEALRLGEPGWTTTRSVYRLRHVGLFGAGPAAWGVQLSIGYTGFPSARSRDVERGNGKAAADLLGIRYGVEFGRPAPSFYAKLGFEPLSSAFDGYVRVMVNRRAQPRVTLWPHAVAGPGLSSCGAPTLPGAVEKCRADLEPIGSARIVAYEDNQVKIETDAPSAGILRLADTWSEGWRAIVDGAPAEALMTDGGLRSVKVGPGKHLVLWKYRAPGLVNGAIASAISLMLLALLAFARPPRARELA